jgi:hypothetical protein
MDREKNPWRSVSGCKDLQYITLYHLNGIPYCLPVYPDGKFESIDLGEP